MVLLPNLVEDGFSISPDIEHLCDLEGNLRFHSTQRRSKIFKFRIFLIFFCKISRKFQMNWGSFDYWRKLQNWEIIGQNFLSNILVFHILNLNTVKCWTKIEILTKNFSISKFSARIEIYKLCTCLGFFLNSFTNYAPVAKFNIFFTNFMKFATDV